MAPQVSTGLLRDVGGCGDFGGGENLGELHEAQWDIGNMAGDGGAAWGLRKDSGIGHASQT